MTELHAACDGLRERREALGLTLEQVQAETRIPIAHLRAIEDGRPDLLPDGPFRAGWVRAYRERLGLDPDGDDGIAAAVAAEMPVGGPTSRVPLWVVRVVAASAFVGLLAMAVWRVRQLDLPSDAPEDAAAAAIADQHLRIRALKVAPLRVIVDGEVAVDRTLAPGEEVAVDGRDRVEIDVPSCDAVKISWNDDAVVPQGRQDLPRRLVFVDDGGAP